MSSKKKTISIITATVAALLGIIILVKHMQSAE